MKSARGFTLIELLVVISIIALTGAIGLANYGSFGEEQSLKNAVLDIQSLFRQAQTNATSNNICSIGYGATWMVEFTDSTTVNLLCQERGVSTTTIKKTLSLGPNIIIQSVAGNNPLWCPSTLPPPFTVTFDPSAGAVNLGHPRCSQLTIAVQNTKTSSTKSFTIEQGGRIYGQ